MRPHSRLLTAVGGLGMCALAALITHQLAYLAVTAAGLLAAADMTDHGHLSAQWAVVTPAAVLGASGFVLRQVQRLGIRNPLRVLPTAAITSGLFVAQEVTEGFFAGRHVADVVTSPAIITGIALTPLIAWVLAKVLNGVTELVRRFVASPTLVSRRPQSFARRGSLIAIPVRVDSSSSPRGPPGRRSFQD